MSHLSVLGCENELLNGDQENKQTITLVSIE